MPILRCQHEYHAMGVVDVAMLTDAVLESPFVPCPRYTMEL